MSTDLYLGEKRPNFPYETSYRNNGVIPFNPTTPLSPLSSSPRHIKRPRFSTEENAQKIPPPPPTPKGSRAVDFSNPTATGDILDGLDRGRFGSVTKDIEALLSRKMRTLYPYFEMYPELVNRFIAVESKRASKPEDQEVTHLAFGGGGSNVIDLEDDFVPASTPRTLFPAVTIDLDSDEEEDKGNDSTPSYNFQSVFSVPPGGGGVGGGAVSFMKEIEVRGGANMVCLEEKTLPKEAKNDEIQRDKGVYVGVEEDEDPQDSPVGDGLDDIWNEMSMGLEVSKVSLENKDGAVDPSLDEQAIVDEESCDHSYVLKDDLGYVCRVCGVIDRGIDTIFEFQYAKVKRSSRTYLPDSRSSKDRESVGIGGLNLSGDDDITVSEVYAHPRHTKQMKPHQVEGFEFLVNNLVGENPGGCILAHAPGSGKTFMIISFVQSFLAKYPNARPLVILPKGILSTWKKEFQIWQVEDIPLYDFYTVKAENRYQQLDVLRQWVETKSILFLGYKQFSTIICDLEDSEVSGLCREILLKAPSILIMDEGHTPRNENTDMLQSIAKIQTPRKVVLSGTLYQNHVKEVFNILNLVRPKFLKMEKSRPIVKRIMAKVDISGRKNFKSSGDASFFDIVEDTLQRDKDFRRKVSVIHDLREMTSKVLHYYKGDFLDELPGLLDFTVVLNLSPKQKRELVHIKKMSRKFKATSVGSAVYLHPKLVDFSDTGIPSDAKMDELLETLDLEEGVKAKFFLNMLSLCEASKEKLLVFSQYLIPLKFLERLVMRERGWSLGKEIFVISGESSHDQREWAMEHFNNSPSARVFFGSIKACGEGISLVGASRIMILDVHLNPSVTRQAIGRAFRPGQKNRVVAYRLIASDSPEEEDHKTCFKKELISKMWFEWNEYCGYKDFEVLTVDIKDCDDEFLENSFLLSQDVKLLYKR